MQGDWIYSKGRTRQEVWQGSIEVSCRNPFSKFEFAGFSIHHSSCPYLLHQDLRHLQQSRIMTVASSAITAGDAYICQCLLYLYQQS